MSDNPDRKLTVSIEADKQAAAETAAILREHAADTRRVAQSYRELAEESRRLATIGTTTFESSTSAVEENADAVKRLRDEYIKAADAAGRVKQQHSGLTGGALLRPGAQLLGAMGLHGVAEPLRMTHDLQELSEHLKKLQEAAEAGSLSVKGLVEGIGPLALIAVAVTLALKDLELIMDLLKKQAEELVDEEKGRYEQEQKEIEQRAADKKEAKTATGEQVTEEIGDATDRFSEQQKEIEKLQARIADNNKALADLGPVGLDPISAAIYAVKRHPLDALAEQLNKELADAMQKQNEAGATAIDKGTNVKPTVDAREVTGKWITEQQNAWSTLTKTIGGVVAKDFKDIEDATSKHRTEVERILKQAEAAHRNYEDSVRKEADAVAALDKLQKAHSDWQSQQVIDDAREAYRGSVEKEYADKIAAAKREEAEQAVRDKLDVDNAKAVKARDERRNEIDQQYMDNELQRLADFTKQQSEEEERSQKDRLRIMRDGQRDLKSLAASGDVAGFVERRQKLQDALDDQKANSDAQTKQRIEAYQKESQAAQQEYAKQLQALDTSFDKERDARTKAAEDRIASIEAEGEQANSKSAQLERELNDIREQWRRQDLETQRSQEEANWQERITNAQNALNELRDAENQMYTDWVNLLRQGSGMLPMQTPADKEYNQTAFEAQGQEYSIGAPSIGKEGYYKLHPRERVLNERENYDYTFGKRDQPVNVYLDATVGDVATKSALEGAIHEVSEAVALAVEEARGRG